MAHHHLYIPTCIGEERNVAIFWSWTPKDNMWEYHKLPAQVDELECLSKIAPHNKDSKHAVTTSLLHKQYKLWTQSFGLAVFECSQSSSIQMCLVGAVNYTILTARGYHLETTGSNPSKAITVFIFISIRSGERSYSMKIPWNAHFHSHHDHLLGNLGWHSRKGIQINKLNTSMSNDAGTDGRQKYTHSCMNM